MTENEGRPQSDRMEALTHPFPERDDHETEQPPKRHFSPRLCSGCRSAKRESEVFWHDRSPLHVLFVRAGRSVSVSGNDNNSLIDESGGSGCCNARCVVGNPADVRRSRTRPIADWVSSRRITRKRSVLISGGLFRCVINKRPTSGVRPILVWNANPRNVSAKIFARHPAAHNHFNVRAPINRGYPVPLVDSLRGNPQLSCEVAESVTVDCIFHRIHAAIQPQVYF